MDRTDCRQRRQLRFASGESARSSPWFRLGTGQLPPSSEEAGRLSFPGPLTFYAQVAVTPSRGVRVIAKALPEFDVNLHRPLISGQCLNYIQAALGGLPRAAALAGLWGRCHLKHLSELSGEDVATVMSLHRTGLWPDERGAAQFQPGRQAGPARAA